MQTVKRNGIVYMIGRCPYCHLPFEFPEKDKINVILFGNWKKYHDCEKKPDMERMS